MKYLLSFTFLAFGGFFALAQSIHVEQLDHDFQSYFIPSEIAFVDSILNAGEFTISLASLKRKCDSPNNCYEQSIIIDDFDWSVSPEDSSFGTTYLKKVRTDLFDSIISLELEDYQVVLERVLRNPPKKEGEIIDICYNPRHAILIKDTADKIIGVFEICFECNKSKVAFRTVEWVQGISYSIRNLFEEYGLK